MQRSAAIPPKILKAACAAVAVVAAALLWDIASARRSDPPSRLFKLEDLDAELKSLPGRNQGRFGKPGNPLNLLFFGTEDEVRRALSGAGWTEIPLSVSASLLAGLGELARGRRLERFPPMNLYRLGGRVQTMNWVRVARPVAERHHFRLWRTGLSDARGRELWWGHGDYDLSVRWWDLSHRPDPEINRERDFLAGTLRERLEVETLRWVPLPQIPRSGANDKGYPFRTDGRALLVRLR